MLIEVVLVICGLLILLLGRNMHRIGRIPQPPAITFNLTSEHRKDQRHDIYHIAFLLRQKLVPDVVPAILHHAGIFERSTHFTGAVQRPMVVTQNSAPQMTLVTSPIRSPIRVQHPVRKVVLSIQSCDQGWADDSSASWTWFTAGINPKDQDGNEESAPQEVSRPQRDDRFLAREREIFRNDAAVRDMKLHILEWSVDSDNDLEREWVEALGNGDRIAIRAWAQFPGWQNKVKSVSVAIYTAALI